MPGIKSIRGKGPHLREIKNERLAEKVGELGRALPSKNLPAKFTKYYGTTENPMLKEFLKLKKPSLAPEVRLGEILAARESRIRQPLEVKTIQKSALRHEEANIPKSRFARLFRSLVLKASELYRLWKNGPGGFLLMGGTFLLGNSKTAPWVDLPASKDKTSWTLGRIKGDVDVHLSDNDTMSRRQAAATEVGGHLYFQDLQSLNGTWFWHEKTSEWIQMVPAMLYRLGAGDRIGFGHLESHKREIFPNTQKVETYEIKKTPEGWRLVSEKAVYEQEFSLLFDAELKVMNQILALPKKIDPKKKPIKFQAQSDELYAKLGQIQLQMAGLHQNRRHVSAAESFRLAKAHFEKSNQKWRAHEVGKNAFDFFSREGSYEERRGNFRVAGFSFEVATHYVRETMVTRRIIPGKTPDQMEIEVEVDYLKRAAENYARAGAQKDWERVEAIRLAKEIRLSPPKGLPYR